jgi:NAD-dependent SIR2 family protein deacetylase
MTLDLHLPSLEHAAELIEQADALIIAAGAGMGVDSGMPDFRGQKGFWAAYPALAAAGIVFTSIANPKGFVKDARLAWGFYGHRLSLYRQTVPHAGFGILKRWANAMPLGATVFTSNVDGQFQKAGFDPKQIHECHGSLHYLQCIKPCTDAIWSAQDIEPTVDMDRCHITSTIPLCPECHGLARPNVMMFNDWDWLSSRTNKQSQQQEAWLQQTHRPVVIELGAGTAIPSVRHFSQRILTEFSGRLIRINPREWQVPTPLDIGVPLGALSGLQAIDALLRRV